MPVEPPANLTIEDYEAIEAAVMETVRGRWFLAEFARRQRQIDTEQIIERLDHLRQILEVKDTSPITMPVPMNMQVAVESVASQILPQAWPAVVAAAPADLKPATPWISPQLRALDALPIEQKLALFS